MYRKNHIIEFKTIDYSRLFICLPVFNECTFSPRYCLLQNAGHFARIFFMKKKLCKKIMFCTLVVDNCSNLFYCSFIRHSLDHASHVSFYPLQKKEKKRKWKRDIYCTVVLKGLHLNSPLFYYVLVVESLDFVLYFCFCCNPF